MCDFGEKVVPSVDYSRLKLIESMTKDQKEMFTIGMCYHSAFLSYLEKQEGKVLLKHHEYELQSVIDALNSQGLKTELNT